MKLSKFTIVEIVREFWCTTSADDLDDSKILENILHHIDLKFSNDDPSHSLLELSNDIKAHRNSNK